MSRIAKRLRELSHPMAEAMSDKSRLDAFVSAGIEAADEIVKYAELLTAVRALIADVRRRYPGEELKCEYMRRLDELSN